MQLCRLGLGISRGLLPILLLAFFWQTRINLFPVYEIYDYLIPFVYFTDLIILVLIVSEFFIKPDWIRAILVRKKGWSLFLLLFLLQATFSIVFASHPVSLVYKLVKLGLFFIFALWVMRLRTRFSENRIFLLISLGLVPLVMLGLFEVIFGQGFGLKVLGEWKFSIHTLGIAKIYLFGKEWLRPYSTFPHPNVFGGVMAVFSLIWWIGFLRERLAHKREKLNLFLAIVFSVALIVSASRSAWIAFLMSGIYIVWQVFSDQEKKSNIWEGVVFYTVWVSILILTGLRLDAFLAIDKLSLLRRLELNKAAIAMWFGSLWFGVGLSQFIVLLDKYWQGSIGRFIQPVHNIYLLILAENGIIGTVSLIGLILKPIIVAWGRLSLEVRSIWLIIFITGLVDHYWWSLQQGLLLFFLTLGLSLATMDKEVLPTSDL